MKNINKDNFLIKKSRFFFVLMLLLMVFNTKVQAQGVDVVFWLDNSSSISTTEWTNMTNSTKTLIDQILACNSNNRVAVVHYGATMVGEVDDQFESTSIYIESNFTNNATTAKNFSRRTALVGDWDYASPALVLIGNSLDGINTIDTNGDSRVKSTQKVLTKNPSNKLVVFLFTDAFRNEINNNNSALISDLNHFAYYNDFKANRDATFVVLHAPTGGGDPSLDDEAHAAAAAIASTGGSYNGPVEANAWDPQGSGTTPRKAVISSTFDISSIDIATITNDICSVAPSCAAGTVAPALTNATVTSQTVDLSTMVTGTPPAGSVLQWHSSATPSATTLLPSTTVTATSTPTNYWAFYYSSTGLCYSPGAKVIVVSNNCTANATTVDLTALPHAATSPDIEVVWYTTPTRNAGTEVSNPTAVGNGTYWPYFHDTANNCFSPAGTPVVVGTVNCPPPSSHCTKPGATGTPLKSSVGIMTKETRTVDGWPTDVPNGYLVLDAAQKGMVITHMTTNQINALVPVEGMLVYDTDQKCVKLYRGTSPGVQTTRTGWVCIERICND